jgi:large subunit ribosomal protein L4
MPEVAVKKPSGSKAGTVDLDDAVFGVEPNVPLLHQVVTAQLAARRAGTHSTKTRAEVRGGGAKPGKQKGTGRARAGSTRSPIWIGGGIAHGPKPRSYAQRTNKKMIKLALRSALSDRCADGKVVVVESWGLDQPSTKKARAALTAVGVEGKVLVVIERGDDVSARSFRNLPDVHVLVADQLNAYDVLVNDYVVFTTASLPGTVDPSATADPTPTEQASEPDSADGTESTESTESEDA